jgi:DNA-binding MarR family transcriptional regulator
MFVALGGSMNAIFFGLKRAYHGTLRIARSTLRLLGLTAARFDMLYAIHLKAPLKILQSILRRTLGVSSPTTSRMLASLEEFGLVRRTRVTGDRRQRWVELTVAGRASIQRASWMMIRTGQAQLAVDSAISPDRWYDAEHCFFAMEVLDSFLSTLRVVYRDVADLYYRWHPDD